MKQRYGLSAAFLKSLAALFMLVDHIGVAFPHLASDLGLPAALDLLPRLIGRLAFPIFAYFLAEGCRRTRFFSRYLFRLGLFTLIAQIPYTLLTGVWGGSIMLSFFLSACAIYGFEQLSRRNRGPAVAALPLFASCVLALLLNTDYGFPAVVLVFSLYLCGEERKKQLLCMGIGLALFYLIYLPLGQLLAALPTMTQAAFGGYIAQVFSLYGIYGLCAELSLLLLAGYRGQLGIQNKWFFYVFYPAHLLGLWALSNVL